MKIHRTVIFRKTFVQMFLAVSRKLPPGKFPPIKLPPGELTPGKFPPGIFPLMFLYIPTRFFCIFCFFFSFLSPLSLILLKRLFCNSNVFKVLKSDLLQCIKKKNNNYNLLLIILSQEIKNRQLYRKKSAGSNYFQMKFIYEK